MTVSGFELAGIITAGIITAFAILLTMLAAEAVKARQISDAITHMRWSGIMTFTSFALMVALFYKCEAICWSAKHLHDDRANTVAEQIAVETVPTHVVCVTPSGAEIDWEITTNGMRSRARTGRERGDSLRRSFGNLGVASLRFDGMRSESATTGWDGGDQQITSRHEGSATISF